MGPKLTQNGTQIETQNGTENENNEIHWEATTGSNARKLSEAMGRNAGKQWEATGREATPGSNAGKLSETTGRKWNAGKQRREAMGGNGD